VGTYTAIDNLAVNGPRVHDITNEHGIIEKITFQPGQRVAVSEYIAVTFLSKVDSFTVYNPENGRVKWKKAEEVGESEIQLQVDEVIAKLSDLKSDSLRRLAKARGVSFTSRTTDENIIAKMTLEEQEEIAPAKVELANEDGEVVID
jgi:hypothetical protein